VIGTLNEGALHRQLKEWYREPGDLLEQRIDGYVVDLVRGDLLVELQTGGFAPLRRKLDALSESHSVRLVAPIAVSNRIVKLSDEGEVLSARRSPRKGCVEDVFGRLVSIPALLCRPTFDLEVLLIHQEELRVFRPGTSWRRRGWTVLGRSLVSVEESVRIASPADLLRFVPESLGDTFDTADIAQGAHVARRVAQQLAYCLRAMGAIEPVGKRGRSVLYAVRS
jgi:hypothetical protein